MVDSCLPPAVCIGWKGYILVDGSVIPYTSADFSEKIQHIPSDDIHGGGVGTTHGAYHSQINAAEGQIMFDGTVNGNVYIGTTGFGLGFNEVLKRAIGGSATDTSLRECGFDGTHPLIVSWGGCGFDGSPAARFPAATAGRAVVETFNLNGNLGGLTTWDATLQASSRGDTSTAPTTADFTFESGSDLGAGSPVPWHQTSLAFSGLGEAGVADRIREWSVSVSNNTTPTWTFNGERTPRDIYQGQMEITGSFDYYSDDEDFSSLTNGSTLTITLGTDLGAGAITLFSPYLALDPRPIKIDGVNDLATRSVQYRMLGSSSGGSLYIT